MSEIYDNTVESIKRIQEFQTSQLPRLEALGNEINFANSVKPADKIVELYKRISIEALKDFPDTNLTTIQTNANADYNRFEQILDFKIAQANPDPESKKNNLIAQLEKRYQPLFMELRDIISYCTCRTTDFRLIEQDARNLFQSIKDDSKKIQENLVENKTESSKILEDIRKVAAEQGVSQQAKYFKDEHDIHEKQAKIWLRYTVDVAIVLVVVSIGMIVLSKWNWLAPKNSYEAMQLIASKSFTYATITYLLYLCGKNFLGHKHNSVLNKHRQNALLTYKTMSDAGETRECREIILAQASYCMYSPQDTGYIKIVSNSDVGMKTFIDSIPKTVVKVDGTH
ncbi:MAG: hypothetical protein D3923_07985 [Candidatus Electrothrix sp. AR3]|nr:hypothetical protein [Candidatus Electrothrix sp. AR3]